MEAEALYINDNDTLLQVTKEIWENYLGIDIDDGLAIEIIQNMVDLAELITVFDNNQVEGDSNE